MAKKKRGEPRRRHGWFVTFADLMALLMSFFVMLVAFSTQDSEKLQIVAGSMRDAFGVQTEVRYSGIIEVDGLADAAASSRTSPDQSERRFRDARPGRQEHANRSGRG